MNTATDSGRLRPRLRCKCCGGAMRRYRGELTEAGKLGLCRACWLRSPNGLARDRKRKRKQAPSSEPFPVTYTIGARVYNRSIDANRAAIRRNRNGSIVTVEWSDGIRTQHHFGVSTTPPFIAYLRRQRAEALAAATLEPSATTPNA